MNISIEETLATEFLNKHPQKATETYDALTPEDQISLFDSMSSRDAAIIFKRANAEGLSRIAPLLKESHFLDSSVEPNDLAKVTSRLSAVDAENFNKKIPKHLRDELESALTYPPDIAGSLMDRRVHLFHPSDLVSDVIESLRRSKTKNVTSIFLVDFDGRLESRIYLQDLIVASDNAQLSTLAKNTPWVNEMAPKDEIIETVEKNKIPSVPVLNSDNVLLGVIRHEQLVVIAHEDALDSMQKMVGVSADEKALSPAFFSVKKRLPWLTVNLLTTFIAAFVVGLFEDTIAKITALAVLLPVVAGQSGNTGAQAQAVTMRGLALREIRLRHKWKVIAKESTVGLVNGIAVGAMCTISVFLWSQSLPLALVIGVAMVLAMVAASLSGAAIPMILTALGQDPATSSSIILTTITDIVGFLSFLGLAALFQSYIAS